MAGLPVALSSVEALVGCNGTLLFHARWQISRSETQFTSILTIHRLHHTRVVMLQICLGGGAATGLRLVFLCGRRSLHFDCKIPRQNGLNCACSAETVIMLTAGQDCG